MNNSSIWDYLQQPLDFASFLLITDQITNLISAIEMQTHLQIPYLSNNR